MADKKSGLEMMVEAALRYAGINPKEIITDVQNTVLNFKSGLELLQSRLDAIDARQAAILKHFDIADPVQMGDTAERQPLRIVGNEP